MLVFALAVVLFAVALVLFMPANNSGNDE